MKEKIILQLNMLRRYLKKILRNKALILGFSDIKVSFLYKSVYEFFYSLL